MYVCMYVASTMPQPHNCNSIPMQFLFICTNLHVKNILQQCYVLSLCKQHQYCMTLYLLSYPGTNTTLDTTISVLYREVSLLQRYPYMYMWIYINTCTCTRACTCTLTIQRISVVFWNLVFHVLSLTDLIVCCNKPDRAELEVCTILWGCELVCEWYRTETWNHTLSKQYWNSL